MQDSINTAEIPFFYSNVMGISMSQNDFTFDFGYKTATQAPPDKFDVRARVSMSPSHAKHLLLILKGIVDKYEEGIGEIPLEKDKREQYNAIFRK